MNYNMDIEQKLSSIKLLMIARDKGYLDVASHLEEMLKLETPNKSTEEIETDFLDVDAIETKSLIKEASTRGYRVYTDVVNNLNYYYRFTQDSKDSVDYSTVYDLVKTVVKEKEPDNDYTSTFHELMIFRWVSTYDKTVTTFAGFKHSLAKHDDTETLYLVGFSRR